MTPRIGVVLVTHNSSAFLPETLASVVSQNQVPDVLLAIDDHSTDNTRYQLEAAGFATQLGTSPATDTTTRIAHNFLQGLRAAQLNDVDIVILGDHDDIWHASRIAHQVELLENDASAAMVASNGYLIDEHGVAIAGTLRDFFPVPGDFAWWSPRRQWAYAVRHSLATGGASAVRISRLSDWSIPQGWLHDRWWSLRALKEQVLVIDETPVIDYRLSDHQQVGLDRGHQDSLRNWLMAKASATGGTLRRTKDLSGLL